MSSVCRAFGGWGLCGTACGTQCGRATPKKNVVFNLCTVMDDTIENIIYLWCVLV